MAEAFLYPEPSVDAALRYFRGSRDTAEETHFRDGTFSVTFKGRLDSVRTHLVINVSPASRTFRLVSVPDEVTLKFRELASVYQRAHRFVDHFTLSEAGE